MINVYDCLVCPKTKQPLKADSENNFICSYDKKIKYPVKEGIIDLISEKKDNISESYDHVSSSYDKLLTSSTFLTRIYNRIVWGLYDSDYVNQLMSLFPDSVNRIILDIPVGTGVFTAGLYKKAAESSRIIAIDYSMGMLRKAKERYESDGIKNVLYIRGDVGNLPFANNTADILMTMNGFHAFPEKEKALSEITRVVKPGGSLLGCFYIKNERAFTDFFINNIYKKLGSFTPPFYDFDEVKDKWSNYFEFKEFRNIKSILYFSGVKR